MSYTAIIFNNAELHDRLTIRFHSQEDVDKIERLIELYRLDPKCKNLRVLRDVESIMFS